MTFDQFRQKTNVLSVVCIEIGKKTDKHFASLPSKIKCIYERFKETKERGTSYTVVKNLTFTRQWEDRVPNFEEFQETSNVRKLAHKLISWEIEKEKKNRDQVIRDIYDAARNGTSHHLLSKIELIQSIPIGSDDELASQSTSIHPSILVSEAGVDGDLILNIFKYFVHIYNAYHSYFCQIKKYDSRPMW